MHGKHHRPYAPPFLQQAARWVCLRIEERDGRRVTVPYNPKTGTAAGKTAPDTWTTYREAQLAWNTIQSATTAWASSSLATTPACG